MGVFYMINVTGCHVLLLRAVPATKGLIMRSNSAVAAQTGNHGQYNNPATRPGIG